MIPTGGLSVSPSTWSEWYVVICSDYIWAHKPHKPQTFRGTFLEMRDLRTDGGHLLSSTCLRLQKTIKNRWTLHNELCGRCGCRARCLFRKDLSQMPTCPWNEFLPVAQSPQWQDCFFSSSCDLQFQSQRNVAIGRITSNLKRPKKSCLDSFGLRPFGRSSSSTEAPLTLMLHPLCKAELFNSLQRCPACAASLLNLPHPVHYQFITSSVRLCLSLLALMIVFSRLNRFLLDRCALQRSPGRQCQAAGKLDGRVRPFGKARAYKIETRKT